MAFKADEIVVVFKADLQHVNLEIHFQSVTMQVLKYGIKVQDRRL